MVGSDLQLSEEVVIDITNNGLCGIEYVEQSAYPDQNENVAGTGKQSPETELLS